MTYSLQPGAHSSYGHLYELGPPTLHPEVLSAPEKLMTVDGGWRRGCQFSNGVAPAEVDEKKGSRGTGQGLREDNGVTQNHNVLSVCMDLSKVKEKKAEVASG